MTLKHSVFVFAAVVLAMASPAGADALEGVYVGVKAIYSYQDVSSPLMKTDTDEWYFDDEEDWTAGGGLALGYDFDQRFSMPVRVELEYTLREKAEVAWRGTQGIFIPGNFNWEVKGRTGVDTLLVNLFYDFKNSSAFTPFVTAGAGISFIEWKSSYADTIGTTPVSAENDLTDFAWSVGLGCSYRIADGLMLDLAYRFLDAGTAEAKYRTLTAEADLHLQEVILGLRYAF